VGSLNPYRSSLGSAAPYQDMGNMRKVDDFLNTRVLGAFDVGHLMLFGVIGLCVAPRLKKMLK